MSSGQRRAASRAHGASCALPDENDSRRIGLHRAALISSEPRADAESCVAEESGQFVRVVQPPPLLERPPFVAQLDLLDHEPAVRLDPARHAHITPPLTIDGAMLRGGRELERAT